MLGNRQLKPIKIVGKIVINFSKDEPVLVLRNFGYLTEIDR